MPLLCWAEMPANHHVVGQEEAHGCRWNAARVRVVWTVDYVSRWPSVATHAITNNCNGSPDAVCRKRLQVGDDIPDPVIGDHLERRLAAERADRTILDKLSRRLRIVAEVHRSEGHAQDVTRGILDLVRACVVACYVS